LEEPSRPGHWKGAEYIHEENQISLLMFLECGNRRGERGCCLAPREQNMAAHSLMLCRSQISVGRINASWEIGTCRWAIWTFWILSRIGSSLVVSVQCSGMPSIFRVLQGFQG
jgi:hypothetical protein